MSKSTAEQRRAAAAKGAQTARRNRERRERMELMRGMERQATLHALREIRDNAKAPPADRLRAIEMLAKIERN